MANKETIEVSRKLMNAVGWTCVLFGLFGLGFVFAAPSASALIGALIVLLFGALFVLSARNVKRIVVDQDSIQFLPVGEKLAFSEIERMVVPDWADRIDTPPNAVGFVTFETNTNKARYVPGAILQWNGRCRVNFVGSDGNRMVATLRKHLPE